MTAATETNKPASAAGRLTSEYFNITYSTAPKSTQRRPRNTALRGFAASLPSPSVSCFSQRKFTAEMAAPSTHPAHQDQPRQSTRSDRSAGGNRPDEFVNARNAGLLTRHRACLAAGP